MTARLAHSADNATWTDLLREYTRKLASVFVPLGEFESSLRGLLAHRDCPFEAVQFELIPEPPFPKRHIGVKGDGEPEIRQEQFGGRNSCRISVWRKHGGPPEMGTEGRWVDMIALVRAFWKQQMRDEKSRLLSSLVSGGEGALDETLDGYRIDQQEIFLFFCDIDHFKPLNDKLGESEGDRVIRELALVLDDVVQPDAVAIHRSGDEFLVLYPTRLREDALHLAYKITRAVRDHDFNVGDFTVNLSIGAAPLSDLDGISQGADGLYKKLERCAELALKPNGVKSRGTARLSPLAQERLASEGAAHDAVARHRAICQCKSRLDAERPFESPWLNLIARVAEVRRREGDGLEAEILRLLEWMKVDWDHEILRAGVSPDRVIDTRPTFSAVDAALAVAHGVWRAALGPSSPPVDTSLGIGWSTAHKKTELVMHPSGEPLVTIPRNGAGDDFWDLGGFVFRKERGRAGGSTSKALLVKLGNAPLSVSLSIFSSVVVVDDRPFREGGLPDLWEATLADLFAHVEANPNVEVVYVLGDPSSAPETVRRLEHLDWLEENIARTAYKTGVSEGVIRSVIERLKQAGGRVHFFREESEMLVHLATLLSPRTELCDAVRGSAAPGAGRFLQRELRLDATKLTRADGCRVGTIAEAFPTIVEIVRSAPDATESRDQQGRKSKELLDFTVRLTDPRRDRVPNFYANEADSLEGYFKRQFIQEGGIFYAQLVADSQLDRIVRHLSAALRDPKGAVGTRRAILVGPRGPSEDRGAELAPPQLISLRVFPRESGGRIAVRCGFTWRSMEVLVGFPYTLYASVRFSEYVVERIHEAVGETIARRIELGEVTYTACSLHFFLGDYGERVARRIVDEASL